MNDEIDDLALLELLESGDDGSAQLPSADIWAGDALARAWAAAVEEFAASPTDGVSLSLPALSREDQLLASPLWYAPKSTAPVQCNISVKRKRSPSADVLNAEAPEPEVNRADEESSAPYLDLADYETVTPPNQQPEVALPKMPSPPAPESAGPPAHEYAQSQTQQDALQRALDAWYTAGYATALYHARSGLVQL